MQTHRIEKGHGACERLLFVPAKTAAFATDAVDVVAVLLCRFICGLSVCGVQQ